MLSIRRLVPLALALTAFVQPVSAQMRGFNLERVHERSQDELNDMANYYGASFVRLSFATTPLYEYNEETFQWRRNEQNFKLLNLKLSQLRKANLLAVVDPHRVFASRNPFTLSHRSDFWTDARHGAAWVEALADLGGYLNNSKYSREVWGIDLVNEPGALVWRTNTGIREGDPTRYLKTDINLVYQQAIKKIREVNKQHRLIVMFFEEDFRDGVVKSPNFYINLVANKDRAAAKADLYFSFHKYWPSQYSFQGLQGRASGLSWPNNPPYATTENLNKRFRWITDWQKQYNVLNSRIFVGEFGLTQGPGLAWNGNTDSPSNGGRRWFDQVLNKIRKYHWTVHQYGGNKLFDINSPPARREYIRDAIQGERP